MTTPDTTRAVEIARNTPDRFSDDAERSLFIAADRMYWAGRADGSGVMAGTRGAAERHDAAVKAFAKMLNDPANIGAVCDLIRDAIRQRKRVAILRGSIAGDPKDLAAGLPDGLTPIGTLEATYRYAQDMAAAFTLLRELAARTGGTVDLRATFTHEADPTSIEDMLNDTGDHLTALRGALELTKD